MVTADSKTTEERRVEQEFGPYRIVRRLGVGGMAETFEAVRTGPGGFSQRVCLKLVLPFYRDRRDFLELFEREARLAARLRHGNIVGVLDFGAIAGTSYMALELVDGVDLGTLIDTRPGARLRAEFVALLGHDLAAALEHAHDPRRDGSDGSGGGAIVHRDISPSNVMISRSGEVLLTDFGVAKAVGQAPRPQSAVKGKVPYMSPEQLRAEPLDGRSDLFALGVVLFEALAGQRPYQGDHDPATIMMILEGDRPPLASFAPDAPPGLVDIVESLLAPNRDERPETAAALLELLEPYVPPPRVRRELGALAEEVRAERAATRDPASEPGGYRKPSHDRRGVGRTGRARASAGTSSSARPRPRAAVAALGILALVGGAIFLWQADDRTTAPATLPAATGAPSAAPDNDAEEGEALELPPPVPRAPTETPVSETAPESPRPATPDRSAEARPGRLNVVVFPWGDVWVNGARKGSAPIKGLALKPGRYRVSAGQGKPSQSKTVRVRSGERKTVEFDLTK